MVNNPTRGVSRAVVCHRWAAGFVNLYIRPNETRENIHFPSLTPTDCKHGRVAMALAALDEEAQRIVFVGLCNPFEPRVAVNMSSASRELREATQVLQQQLRVDHEATAALCPKMSMRIAELQGAARGNTG